VDGTTFNAGAYWMATAKKVAKRKSPQKIVIEGLVTIIAEELGLDLTNQGLIPRANLDVASMKQARVIE